MLSATCIWFGASCPYLLITLHCSRMKWSTTTLCTASTTGTSKTRPPRDTRRTTSSSPATTRSSTMNWRLGKSECRSTMSKHCSEIFSRHIAEEAMPPKALIPPQHVFARNIYLWYHGNRLILSSRVYIFIEFSALFSARMTLSFITSCHNRAWFNVHTA